MVDNLARKFSIDDEVDLCSLTAPKIYNSVQNDAFIRAKLLEKVDDYYNKGQEQESIAHQIEALCIGFRSKFMFSKEKKKSQLNDLVSDMMLDVKNGLLRGSSNRQHVLSSEFLPDLSLLDKDLAKSRNDPEPVKLKPVDDTFSRCAELPEEWTVVQITKQIDLHSTLKTAHEILETNSGIYLTVLRYPHMELNGNSAMTVRLPNRREDLYAKAASIPGLIKEAMKIKDVELYAFKLKMIDQAISDQIEHLFLWLGPYITFFLGVFKDPAMVQEEKKILDKVQAFFAPENFTDARSIALTFLIARGIDLLNYEDLECFSINFSKDSMLSKRLLDFLLVLKETSRLKYKSPSYPTILIIDELLDHFYWEMLLPDKETCRCSALHILLEIHKKYRNQIRNGYLRVSTKKGTALVNLNDDLPTMQLRITSFYDYWKPSWTQYVKVSPTEGQIELMLKDSDVIVYTGHGSGRQYLNPEMISQLDVNCVVFLFGCESVKLISYGRCSERIGIHLFYHYILSPLIVGALTIVTDTITDQISVLALGTWLRADKPRDKHVQYIDKKKFKEGKLEFNSHKLFRELDKEYDPNLLSIFSKFRQVPLLSLWMRGAFVLRGIPVWNAD